MSEEVKNTAEAAEAAEAVKAEPVGAGEATAKEYTVEDIQKEIKPLSGNAFVRFWHYNLAVYRYDIPALRVYGRVPASVGRVAERAYGQFYQ